MEFFESNTTDNATMQRLDSKVCLVASFQFAILSCYVSVLVTSTGDLNGALVTAIGDFNSILVTAIGDLNSALVTSVRKNLSASAEAGKVVVCRFSYIGLFSTGFQFEQ